MLDTVSILIGLAQIAAAFAGFAALVSVLRERGQHAEALHDILRLRIVISTSVLVIAAALVPVGLLAFSLDERIIWLVSAILMLMLNYGIIFSFVGSYKPVQGEFEVDRIAVFVTGLLELVDQTALFLIVLDIFPEYRFPLYLTALIINVSQAAFVFIRYVGSEFRASRS
ncbi:MAG: hypothetical protein P8R04_05400 [Gammaproteobacteria bacterium]|nr:hypothetical protein [Gammaproteobacteria bacterium]